jgi:uncharacterized coiled-coil DUF342 family protein
METSSNIIIREYPVYKELIPLTNFYKNSNKNNLLKIVCSIEYKKWSAGINPNSGRKISKKGNIYKKIGYKNNYFQAQAFEKDTLNNEYSYIDKKISQVYMKKHRINNEIKQYNRCINFIRKTINELPWDKYLIFQGKKYGCPKIVKNIHKENDCNGEVKIIISLKNNCRLCKLPKCWNHPQPQSTCNYKYSYKCQKCEKKINLYTY